MNDLVSITLIIILYYKVDFVPGRFLSAKKLGERNVKAMESFACASQLSIDPNAQRIDALNTPVLCVPRRCFIVCNRHILPSIPHVVKRKVANRSIRERREVEKCTEMLLLRRTLK